MENITASFMEALLSLDRLSVRQILEDHTRQTAPITFIEEVVVVALERIGAQWEEGTLALSQVYMSGRLCEELIDEVLPPQDLDRKNQPKMAICILSDHHKLGKTIVFSLLRASGFELIDYDTIEVDDLVDRVKQEKIKILLISVLMLPSALKVKQVKEKLADMNLDVKIIVGGAPFRFDDQLWQEVGAHAMCATASEAVSIIHDVMGGVE